MGAIKVQWLGQSAFRITTASGKVIVTDPWLKANPLTPPQYKDLAALGKIDVLLVSYGHTDLLAESGIPGLSRFEADQWYGVVAPAGAPAFAVQKLNSIINSSLTSAEVSARLKSERALATPTTPEAFGQIIHNEMERWRPVVVKARIRAD